MTKKSLPKKEKNSPFTPTYETIIIAIIIFFFMPFINIDTGIRCITQPCNSSKYTGLLSYMLNSPTLLGTSTLYFFLGLTISYLLAILAQILYKKIKSNIENKI
ncbi:MAG: hypothetical protein ACI83O_000021 [Patescibacteria group bacterium]|jgi:hypothetical protein